MGKLNDKYVYLSEADAEGIASSTLSYYCHKNCMFEMYQVQLDNVLIGGAIEYAIEQEKKHIDYAYGQTGAMALVIGLRKLGIKIKNPFPKGMNCNEYAQRVLAMAGNNVAKHNLKYKDELSPETLRKLLIEDSETKLIARKEFGTTEINWLVD
jgi:hypothetical protein